MPTGILREFARKLYRITHVACIGVKSGHQLRLYLDVVGVFLGFVVLFDQFLTHRERTILRDQNGALMTYMYKGAAVHRNADWLGDSSR